MSSSFYMISWYVYNATPRRSLIEDVRWSGSDFWWVNSFIMSGLVKILWLIGLDNGRYVKGPHNNIITLGF